MLHYKTIEVPVTNEKYCVYSVHYWEACCWLKHHTPERNTTRGSFIDDRYPHWTAVIKDKSGHRWAVDTWYEVGGGLPDIMPLQDWKRRSYGGEC